MIITKSLLNRYLDLGIKLDEEKDTWRRFEIELERENIKYYSLMMTKERENVK